VKPLSGRGRRGLGIAVAVVAVIVGVLVVVMLADRPQAPRDPGPRPGDPGPRPGDPVIAAAGDIACDPAGRSFEDGEGSTRSCHQLAVSDLLLGDSIDRVLALGDLQYYCGSKVAFQESYDLSWGRVKSKTLPVPGNHEYIEKSDASDESSRTGCDSANAGAVGYYDYFGAAAGDPEQGWYSLDIGAWHIVAINSNCGEIGGCDQGDPQIEWLEDDLAAHPAACTLAFWHHPRFSSRTDDGDEDMDALWNVVHATGVDVVLNAHSHVYERFARQDPSGRPDDRYGIRQFVVGTGGANLTKFDAPLPTSQVRNDHTFGVLQMTLRPAGYEWEFVPVEGSSGFTDRGSDQCHEAPE
jgi:acid phosphatase type 7